MAAGSDSFHAAPGMAIRRLTIADVPAVLKILQESPEAAAWSEQSLLQLASVEPAAWVAEIGCGLYAPSPERRLWRVGDLEPARIIEGGVAGFLIGRTAADEFEILNLAVAQAHRREGIGSKLTDAALEFARAAGSARAYLEVRASNGPAIALYARHGFTECGRRDGYYWNPVEDGLVFSLRLDGTH